MNTIIKFPIRVNNTKASEASEGLAPALQGTVADLTHASTENLVSENALRNALNNYILHVYGKNVTTGSRLFKEYSDDELYFRTIKGYTSTDSHLSKSNIVVTQDDDNIYFNVRNDSDIEVDKTAYRIRRSINGGIYQEATTIMTSYIPASGLEIFYDVGADDVIGKIFIRGVTDTSTDVAYKNAIFSVGTSADIQGFVKIFNPPTTDEMLDVDYGSFMYDKKEEADIEHLQQTGSGLTPVNSPEIKSSLIEKESIRIYHHGTDIVDGQMECVIFYDKKASVGLIIGGRPGGSARLIQRYAIYNETSSFTMLDVADRPVYVGVVNGKTDSWIVGGLYGSTYSNLGYRIRHADLTAFAKSGSFLSTARCGSDCESSMQFGYTAGGSSSGSNTLNTIERFDMTVDVPSSADRVKMSTARTHHAMIFNWPVFNYGYIFGGISSESGTTPIYSVDKYFVLTDTVSTLPRTNWTTPANLAGKAVDKSRLWLVEGSTSGLSSTSTRITTMSMADDTTFTTVGNATLAGNQAACVQNATKEYVWLASASNYHVERYSTANGTFTVIQTGVLTDSDYGTCGKGALV